MDDLTTSRKLLSLFNEMPARVSCASADGTLLYGNRSFKEYFGLDGSAIAGLKIGEVLSKIEAEQQIPYVMRVLAGETVSFEVKEHHPEHGRQISSVTLIPDRGECGGVTGYFSFATDVTEENRARQAESMLAAALNSISEGVVLYDSNDRLIYSNAGSGTSTLAVKEKLKLGTPFREVAETFYSTYHSDDPEEIRRFVEHRDAQRKNPGPPVEIELNGHWHLMSDYRTAGGGTLTIYSDITEQKNRELALERAERRYVTAVEAAHTGVWEWNLDTGEFNADASLKHLIGYDADEIDSTAKHWFSHVHPADRAAMLKATDKHLAGETSEFVFEHRKLHKNGSERWFLSRGRLLTDDDTASRRMVGADVDITERKLADLRQQESDNRYRTLLEALPEGIVVTQGEGIVFANMAAARMHGLESPQKLEKMHFQECLHPDDRPRAMEFKAAMFDQGKSRLNKSSRHIRFDNHQETITEDSYYRIEWQGRDSALIVMRDVTERKKAEQALRESEERYGTLVNLLPDGVIVGVEGHIVFVNEGALKMHGGRDPEDMVGRPFTDFIHPDDFTDVAARQDMSVQEGKTFPVAENRHLRLDGSEFLVEKTGQAIRWRGKPASLVVLRDITERKNAERALRESEAMLRLVTDGVTAMIAYIGPDERVRFANQRYAHWMGIPREKLMGMCVRDILGEKRYKASDPYRKKALAGHAVSFESEGSSEITPRPYKATYMPDLDETGQVHGYFSMFIDITEERRMSRALRESEEGFRNLFEAVPEGILVSDGKKIVFANPAAARIHGAESADQLIGMKFQDMLHPDDHARNEDNRVRVVEQRKSFDTGEFKHVRLDTGEIVYTEDNGHSIIWRGEPAGLIVVRDITERRAAESALREREAHLSLIMDNTPAMIGYVETDGRYRYVSRQYEEWFAAPREDIIGQVMWELSTQQLSEVDAREVIATLRKDMDNALAGKTVTVILERPFPDGQYRHIRRSFVPDIAEDGTVRGVFALTTDITDLIEREEQIQRARDEATESEQRLRRVTDNLPGSVFQRILHPDGKVTYPFVNQGLDDIMPFDLDDLDGTSERLLSMVHPDDRNLHLAAIENSAGTLEPFSLDFRAYATDGSLRWLRTSSRPRRLADGSTEWFGVSIDVTEQKMAESALAESEARYRALMELLPDAVIVTVDGKIEFSNSAANRLHGAPEGLVGRQFLDLVHPDNRTEVLQRRFEVNQGVYSLPIIGHRHIRLDNGEEMVVEKTGQRISWHGKTAALVVVRDITERRLLEETIRENEAFLRLIMDNVPALIAYLEPDGRYKYVSRQYEQWLGIEPKNMIGKTPWDFLPPQFPDAFRERFRATLKSDLERALSGEIVKTESERDFESGKRFVQKFMLADMRESDKPLGVFSMISDITELKLQERELRAARDEAERANQSKSRFLASASHDLRQPLQAINLLSFALSESVATEEDQQLVRDMRHALTVMDSVLNGLIDISKLEAGVVSPQIQDVPLECLCDSLRVSFAVQAREKGLDFQMVPCRMTVHTDPDLLSRILDNLVSNAIKYTDQGRILIGARRRGDKLRIEVHDTGRGIPAAELNRIFEEFYQLDNPARDRNKGLGLGLAIVERTARLLDYPLDASSREGIGSVFSVTVPLSDSAALHSATGTRKAAKKGDLSDARILVIEDDDTVRAATQRLLRRWGAQVTMAASYDEGLRIIAEDTLTPDLVVADYRLDANHKGTDAIMAVRELLGYQVAGIIMTGDIAKELVTEARQAEMEVLHKPVDPVELRRLIVSLVTA